jgi:hypothetical protein
MTCEYTSNVIDVRLCPAHVFTATGSKPCATHRLIRRCRRSCGGIARDLRVSAGAIESVSYSGLCEPWEDKPIGARVLERDERLDLIEQHIGDD